MTSGVARHESDTVRAIDANSHGTNETRLLNLAVAGDERNSGDSGLRDDYSIVRVANSRESCCFEQDGGVIGGQNYVNRAVQREHKSRNGSGM